MECTDVLEGPTAFIIRVKNLLSWWEKQQNSLKPRCSYSRQRIYPNDGSSEKLWKVISLLPDDQRHIPWDWNLRFYRCENLSCLLLFCTFLHFHFSNFRKIHEPFPFFTAYVTTKQLLIPHHTTLLFIWLQPVSTSARHHQVITTIKL